MARKPNTPERLNVTPDTLVGPKSTVEFKFALLEGYKGYGIDVEYCVTTDSSGGAPYEFTGTRSGDKDPHEASRSKGKFSTKKDTFTIRLKPTRDEDGVLPGGLELTSGGLEINKSATFDVDVEVIIVAWVTGLIKPEGVLKKFKPTQVSAQLPILAQELRKKMKPGEKIADIAGRIEEFMEGKEGAVKLSAITNFLKGKSGTLPDTKALFEKFLKRR